MTSARTGRILRWAAAGLAAWAAAGAAAAERHSNGLGGGRWTDPAAWHGGAVPAATDVVVIASGDTVSFDGGGTGAAHCAGIFIDPEGMLTFRTDGAEHVLRVAGAIESYGAIRIDATRDPAGVFGLALSAADDANRAIRLLKGSSLLVYGAPGLAGDGRNVSIAAVAAPGQPPRVAVLQTVPEVMVDLQRAALEHVALRAYSIDNTGFKPGQRLNIVDCRLTGLSRVALFGCDTPVVHGNEFSCTTDTGGEPAITLSGCRLASCRGNAITGPCSAGILTYQDIDSAIASNSIAGPTVGISAGGGQNAMLKANGINGCETGVRFENGTGILEESAIVGALKAAVVVGSTFQFTDVRVEQLREGGTALALAGSAVTLLNCNMASNQVECSGAAHPSDPWVDAMHYLVVRAGGALPAGAEVEVRTAAASGGPPKGAADLNVRNSPARLSPAGLTPLPRTLKPLIVRAWRIERDGRRREAPFYDLEVTAPGEAAGAPRKVLARAVLEPKPDWFRPDPNGPAPTLEVKVP